MTCSSSAPSRAESGEKLLRGGGGVRVGHAERLGARAPLGMESGEGAVDLCAPAARLWTSGAVASSRARFLRIFFFASFEARASSQTEKSPGRALE